MTTETLLAGFTEFTVTTVTIEVILATGAKIVLTCSTSVPEFHASAAIAAYFARTKIIASTATGNIAVAGTIFHLGTFSTSTKRLLAAITVA